ncbi:MAG TPA: VacB/RNase II family 3'-5' exoribonuclease [Stellaceae bacterium]|nr:VacB/RNase II family 3'-5' exoribonuclease [Stellaceae bacterium]
MAAGRIGKRRLDAGTPPGQIVAVEQVGHDEDGVPLVRPLDWPAPAPTFRLSETVGEPLAPGARALVRLALSDGGEVEAIMIRPVAPSGRIVGVFRQGRDGGRLLPVERRDRTEYRVPARDAGGAADGDIVVAEISATGRLSVPRLRIVERLGNIADPRSVSLLAIADHDIPSEFPAAALAEAAAQSRAIPTPRDPPGPREARPEDRRRSRGDPGEDRAGTPKQPADGDGRTDLRALPLVTIDGSDARDFDDAVWAEPDPELPGGWHILVAIADVAWYVRPDSALDREARRRGNSVYFPDRVVPMLPEALSNGLCSLQPGQDRACLAVHLWIDAAGRKRRHRFERAVMRSAARLTYDEVEAARDGKAALPAAPALVPHLYGAYAALARARKERGALDLDMPEDRVRLDADGRPVAVEPVRRLDSHRLIEEFMILANVAAAEELETLHEPALYRVHDAPAPDKLASLREALAELSLPGLALAKGQAPKPELFNRVLRRATDSPAAPIVNELVLRAQAQAAYSPANIGHFGLALRRYVHFTSPIRRYADLIVHRALIAGANRAGRAFGAGGLPPGAGRGFAELGLHLSATERRAAAAERAALDRYRVLLLADSIGGVFAARIAGVAEFGLFVALAEGGAQGLLPIANLPDDFYNYEPRRQRLIGRRSRRIFRLGDRMLVRLVDADPVSGRILFRGEEPSPDLDTRRTRAAPASRRRA